MVKVSEVTAANCLKMWLIIDDVILHLLRKMPGLSFANCTHQKERERQTKRPKRNGDCNYGLFLTSNGCLAHGLFNAFIKQNPISNRFKILMVHASAWESDTY